MKKIALAGILALSASTCLAQSTTSPQPNAPSADTPAGAASQAGGPANLCQELLAFMKAPPPEPDDAAKPAAGSAQQAARAKESAPPQQQASPDQPADPNQEGSSALAGTTATDEGASAEPSSGSNSAQAVTGQEGVASDAPQSGNDQGASGSVANAPQRDTRAAPTPPADVASTPKESVMTVEEAQQLADANDIAKCQEAAREMRVAGVDMPPPLMALAALDLQFQQKSGAAQPPGAADPGQGAAPEEPAEQ